MSPHASWNAPTSNITKSNAPKRCAISAYSGVSPVSPLKNTLCFGPRTTIDDQSVALREPKPRPEKCWDGAALIETPVPGTSACSHQSSSVMRSAGTPQACKCAPTPSDVKNGTSRLASCKIVG